MYDTKKLRKQLVQFEGYKTHPYVDTVGKVTIGIGWNLTDRGLPGFIIELLYDIAREECQRYLEQYHWWEDLDKVRKRVLMDMVYNMGPTVFEEFKNTIHFIERRDYVKAAKNMRLSKWYKQVKVRGRILAMMMEDGIDTIEL